MKLEIGKRYVSRNGMVTAPLEASASHANRYEYPFVDPISCITYTANGSYESYRTGNHANDLIMEMYQEESEQKVAISFWDARAAALSGSKVKKINSDLLYTREDFSVTSEFYFSTGEMAEDWCLVEEQEETEETVIRETKRVKFESTIKPEDKLEVEWGTTDSNGDFVPSKLPPEPVPGQYYRTKGGDKFKFLAKGIRLWIYEDKDGYIALFKSTAYNFISMSSTNDIIAPWTDPLPAVEIKRWAVVLDTRSQYRGAVDRTFESLEEATRQLNGYYKDKPYYTLVELVGTLPSREV